MSVLRTKRITPLIRAVSLIIGLIGGVALVLIALALTVTYLAFLLTVSGLLVIFVQ